MRATLLVSASLLLLPVRLAYGDCNASVGGLTITDSPTATRASASVSFSLTGTGNLSIYINGSHQYGVSVSGTGRSAEMPAMRVVEAFDEVEDRFASEVLHLGGS